MTTDTFYALLWWIGMGTAALWVFILAYVLKRSIEIRRHYQREMSEQNEWEQG